MGCLSQAFNWKACLRKALSTPQREVSSLVLQWLVWNIIFVDKYVPCKSHSRCFWFLMAFSPLSTCCLTANELWKAQADLPRPVIYRGDHWLSPEFPSSLVVFGRGPRGQRCFLGPTQTWKSCFCSFQLSLASSQADPMSWRFGWQDQNSHWPAPGWAMGGVF